MFPPPLLWHDLFADHDLLGSVARGEFVTIDNASSPRELKLWQVNSPPEVRQSYELSADEYVDIRAENDSGKIALITYDSGTKKIYTIETAGEGEMTVNSTTLSGADPTRIFVSQDGEQILLDYGGGNLHAWDYVALTELWDFDFITEPSRESGYIAGFPRADRVLWVNTSPLELTYSYGLAISGQTISSNTTFTVTSSSLPDWDATETVAHVDLFVRVNWGTSSFYGAFPNRALVDPMTTGSSVVLSPSLSADYIPEPAWEVMSYGIGTIADPGPGVYSETINIVNLAVGSGYYWTTTGSWGYANLTYYIDNSDRGGGLVQLLDDTGTVLDDIPNVEEDGFICSWVGTGSNALSYFKYLGDSPGYE